MDVNIYETQKTKKNKIKRGPIKLPIFWLPNYLVFCWSFVNLDLFFFFLALCLPNLFGICDIV